MRPRPTGEPDRLRVARGRSGDPARHDGLHDGGVRNDACQTNCYVSDGASVGPVDASGVLRVSSTYEEVGGSITPGVTDSFVLDAAQTPVADYTMTTGSGLPYPVPEPGPVALAAAALVALGAAHRRGADARSTLRPR